MVAEPTFLQTPQREVEEDARRGEAEEHVVDGEAFLHEKLGEVKEREDQENRDQTVFFSCRRTFQRENSSTGLLQALNFGKKAGMSRLQLRCRSGNLRVRNCSSAYMIRS